VLILLQKTERDLDLLEINTKSIYPREIVLNSASGRMVNIGVEYPWILVQCKSCKSFGHLV
jgi:hypothetical protein